MLRPIFLSLVLFASSASAQGQRDIAAQTAAMRDIAFLQGDWLGQGWRILPTGERVQSTQQVRVQPRASGLALTVEGTSLRQGPAETKPSAGSFAVVTYDERAKRYLFRSFGFGEMIEADARLLAPNKFEWTVPAGQSLLRFVVDGSAGSWMESGYRSTDGGKSWVHLYQLTAHRTGQR